MTYQETPLTYLRGMTAQTYETAIEGVTAFLSNPYLNTPIDYYLLRFDVFNAFLNKLHITIDDDSRKEFFNLVLNPDIDSQNSIKELYEKSSGFRTYANEVYLFAATGDLAKFITNDLRSKFRILFDEVVDEYNISGNKYLMFHEGYIYYAYRYSSAPTGLEEVHVQNR